MTRKHLLWAGPLALLVALGAALLALPSFVAAPAHRTAVEAFASRLTGRDVHISGKLSLSYFPQPEITATGITISGPDKEVITAHALSLDLALAPLLQGQLAARTLDLDTPNITFPWPLPGGISAIAPPPWLAALHAHIKNGRINFGAADFTDVNADLFTGAGGSVSVSGNGKLQTHDVSLSLAVGETEADGAAQITLRAALGGASAHFAGALNAQSELAGQLNLALPGHASVSAQISADANGISAEDISASQDKLALHGTAHLAFAPLGLRADLTGQGLDLDQLTKLSPLWPGGLATELHLDAANVSLAGRSFPALRATLKTSPAGSAVSGLTLGLPGGASLSGDLTISPNQDLSGRLSLAAPDLTALASGLGLPAVPGWTSASLQAQLGGTRDAPDLTDITGTLGADHVNGRVVLSAGHAAFRLAFDQLDLASLAAWLAQRPLGGGVSVAGELTAAHAVAGPLKLSNLFIDADMGAQLDIRRATASLYGGIANGSVTLDRDFKVTSAHAVLDLPSAAPLAALLPQDVKLPAELLRPHLSLVLAAAGPPNALSTSAVATLGDFTLTAAPVIDLTKPSASGALSLRHPDAIAALKLLGLGGGCSRMAPLPGYPFQGGSLPCSAGVNDPGLAFPGPGALALRARFSAAPGSAGLNDFVLSAGQLNASGQIMLTQDKSGGKLSGQIDAGTLALPKLPASLQMPGSLPVSGQIALKANQVLYAGTPVFGATAGTLSFAPDQARLTLDDAAIGTGKLSGSATLKLDPKAPPALSAKFLADGIDAGALALPQSFPLTLTSGQLSATASLTASGYSAKTWAATLGGSATITASNGTLSGLSLPDLASALSTTPRPALSKSLSGGTTPFATLSLAATIAQGNCTLTQAQLTAPAGTLAASGTIDLFESTLALKLGATPAVKPPLTLSVRLSGPWGKPGREYDLKDATGWKPGS